ncbi:MAG: RnfH family protein [Gammaproteobacteria bacterium]|nr:RnfH family protein [Gammaproteobacteria bacterium]
MVSIEVVYALADKQALLNIQVPKDSTVQQAIECSGLLQQFPDIDLTKNAVGVFGRSVDLQHIVEAGNRIEIYRPLVIDPKEARRRRA